jgi:hypothetical protein
MKQIKSHIINAAVEIIDGGCANTGLSLADLVDTAYFILWHGLTEQYTSILKYLLFDGPSYGGDTIYPKIVTDNMESWGLIVRLENKSFVATPRAATMWRVNNRDVSSEQEAKLVAIIDKLSGSTSVLT